MSAAQNLPTLNKGAILAGDPEETWRAIELLRAALIELDTLHAALRKGLTIVEVGTVGVATPDAVKIWAEDNGAGKTRLMAQFQSGAAQQITIEP